MVATSLLERKGNSTSPPWLMVWNKLRHIHFACLQKNSKFLKQQEKKHRLATIFATASAPLPPPPISVEAAGMFKERIEVRQRKRGTRTKPNKRETKHEQREKPWESEGAPNPNSFTALDFFYVVRSICHHHDHVNRLSPVIRRSKPSMIFILFIY